MPPGPRSESGVAVGWSEWLSQPARKDVSVVSYEGNSQECDRAVLLFTDVEEHLP